MTLDERIKAMEASVRIQLKRTKAFITREVPFEVTVHDGDESILIKCAYLPYARDARILGLANQEPIVIKTPGSFDPIKNREVIKGRNPKPVRYWDSGLTRYKLMGELYI